MPGQDKPPRWPQTPRHLRSGQPEGHQAQGLLQSSSASLGKTEVLGSAIPERVKGEQDSYVALGALCSAHTPGAAEAAARAWWLRSSSPHVLVEALLTAMQQGRAPLIFLREGL